MTDEAHLFSLPLSPADPTTFVGPAHVGLLAGGDGDTGVKLYLVRFDTGARTNWHAHAGTQILAVRAGRCRYQREGEPPAEAGPGETVRFDAGVRHWHGATSDGPAEHVAVNLDVRSTTWMEPVDDATFDAPPG